MPQLLLQGFPDGAIRIGPILSVLKKEGRVTYFVGGDNYYSHAETDAAGQRLAIATLITNRHVRASEVAASDLGIAHRTLMHWTRHLDDQGPGAFFAPHPGRGGAVMTSGKAAECERLLDAGATIAGVARLAGVGESTVRKAVRRGRVGRTPAPGASAAPDVGEGTTKSERGRADARAAEGMGTACTRADERMAAALGLLKRAVTRFERCRDVDLGGLLAGLPALCGNGLLSGLGRHLSLPQGFYSALHILVTLGFMALARIRRPEGLRHVPSGELGKVVGLDRVPEVRTLREKIAVMADTGAPQTWMRELSRTWMDADPLLHRFVVIFDREDSSHSLLSQLWAQRIGAITYRKAVKDLWPDHEFSEIEVSVPGGGATRMSLASRDTALSAGPASIPVLEIRRLTATGHQTAIITTARRLDNPVVSGRMFSRWCQENYFRYMMQHYDIDGLVQYGDTELPGTLQVVIPAWRTLDKAVADRLRHLRKQHADLSAATLHHDGGEMQVRAERLEHIQQLEGDIAALRTTRRHTPKKVAIASLPQDQRPRQLAPLGKTLTDTVKMMRTAPKRRWSGRCARTWPRKRTRGPWSGNSSCPPPTSTPMSRHTR